MATEMGKVASLWRYPVKSMSGEELAEGELTEYGLLGDRAYALIDVTEGKAATAKNPGKWPTLFGCRATFVQTVTIGNVRLNITGSCSRCVMTTLAQGNLPKDSGILRTAVQQNQGNVGVYATVLQGGTVKRGDRVSVSG